MKEQLGYTVPSIEYAEQGEPPRRKSSIWPTDAISTRISDRHLQLPPGMTKDQYDFMQDIVSSGTIDEISPESSYLYLLYFTTDNSVKTMPQLGLNSVTVFRRIRYAIRDMWEVLPPDLQSKHELENILKLKGMHRARRGFSRTDEEIEKLRKMGTERMTAEFRKLIGEAVSDSHSPAVLAKIRKAAQARSNSPEGRERMQKWRGTGHRFTSEESRAINTRRLKDKKVPSEPSVERRRDNPLEGALYNLRHIQSDRFPSKIRKFFLKKTPTSFDWTPRSADIKTKGVLRYNQGTLFYVKGVERVELTTTLLRRIWNGDKKFDRDRESIERFGLSTVSELEHALRSRVASFEAYHLQLRTRQFPG